MQTRGHAAVIGTGLCLAGCICTPCAPRPGGAQGHDRGLGVASGSGDTVRAVDLLPTPLPRITHVDNVTAPTGYEVFGDADLFGRPNHDFAVIAGPLSDPRVAANVPAAVLEIGFVTGSGGNLRHRNEGRNSFVFAWGRYPIVRTPRIRGGGGAAPMPPPAGKVMAVDYALLAESRLAGTPVNRVYIFNLAPDAAVLVDLMPAMGGEAPVPGRSVWVTQNCTYVEVGLNADGVEVLNGPFPVSSSDPAFRAWVESVLDDFSVPAVPTCLTP